MMQREAWMISALAAVLWSLCLISASAQNVPHTLPTSWGATNRFEKADAVYGVFGDINQPLYTGGPSYHRVYLMQGQYYESNFSWISNGWEQDNSIGANNAIYYYRRPNGAFGGGRVSSMPMYFGFANFGVQFHPSTFTVSLYVNGVSQLSLSAANLVAVGDFAVAGAVKGSSLPPPDPNFNVTYYNLEWVKRKSDGTYKRKPWPWYLVDLRVGPYSCYGGGTNYFSCFRTY